MEAAQLLLHTIVGMQLGGCFRMFHTPAPAAAPECDDDAPAEAATTESPAYDDFAPSGDRLLAFWSDTQVHSVTPSLAPAAAGDRSHRWALTVWLTTTDPAAIQFDPEMEALHFGSG